MTGKKVKYRTYTVHRFTAPYAHEKFLFSSPLFSFLWGSSLLFKILPPSFLLFSIILLFYFLLLFSSWFSSLHFYSSLLFTILFSSLFDSSPFSSLFFSSFLFASFLFSLLNPLLIAFLSSPTYLQLLQTYPSGLIFFLFLSLIITYLPFLHLFFSPHSRKRNYVLVHFVPPCTQFDFVSMLRHWIQQSLQFMSFFKMNAPSYYFHPVDIMLVQHG